MNKFNNKLVVQGDEIGVISDGDDQSYGMFVPICIVCNKDYTNMLVSAPELLKALRFVQQLSHNNGAQWSKLDEVVDSAINLAMKENTQ